MEFKETLKNNKTFLIAEIGINHSGCVSNAKSLIEAAKRSGADAVKFQTYKTENRILDKSSSLFSILKKCELDYDDFHNLKLFSDNLDIQFFSTPFDLDDVFFLKDIGVNLLKISSFDLKNKAFIDEISKTRIPTLFSTGMGDLNEIRSAFEILTKNIEAIGLLHCISSYPTKEEDALLSNLETLKSEFDCVIGHSDHTNGITVPCYAVAAGARIIEKHFKLTDDHECVDATVSISEKSFKKLSLEISKIEKILGYPKFGVRSIENEVTQYRRIS